MLVNGLVLAALLLVMRYYRIAGMVRVGGSKLVHALMHFHAVNLACGRPNIYIL